MARVGCVHRCIDHEISPEVRIWGGESREQDAMHNSSAGCLCGPREVSRTRHLTLCFGDQNAVQVARA